MPYIGVSAVQALSYIYRLDLVRYIHRVVTKYAYKVGLV